MRRREFVTAAAASAVGVTGCLESGDGAPGGNETDSNGDDGNDGGTSVTDTSFTVVSEGGGDRDEAAAFSFENGTLNVRGTVVGSDLCKTASLDGAEYDEGRGAVVVRVVTVDAEDAPDACGEALKPIEYRATIGFGGARPSVVVTHDGEEVNANEGDGETGGEADGTSLTGTEFEVTGTECGTETSEVRSYIREQGMSEEGVGSKGTVQGTLSGPDSCTTAELGYASYDASKDTLVADVRSASTEEDVCEDCITEVDYRLEATFENGVADSAAVSHDGVRLDAVGEGVEDAEFVVEGTENASGDERSAEPEFDEEDGRVVVRGTILGPDGCATARLAEARVDGGAVSVDVETVDGGGDMCTEALVVIRYTATLTFDGEIPNEVSVAHNGDGFMSGAYGSESASADARAGRGYE